MEERTQYQLSVGRLVGRFVTIVLTTLAIPLAYGTDRGPIQPGETKVAIQLTGPSYMDTWTFSGSAGDRVVINAVTTAGALDTAIVLYPPGGGPAEASTHDYWGGGDRLDHQLLTNGVYTIMIEDHSLVNAGRYNLTLMKTPGMVRPPGDPDPDGGTISSGQTLSGQIQVPSDMDGFQFYGNAGDRILINAVTINGTLDTAIVLYPPTGGEAEASTHGYWGGGDQLDYQLLTNGVYTIMIEDHSLVNTGRYNLTMMKTPGAVNSSGDPDGGAVTSGQTLGGQIEVPSDIDGFQFYGKAGDRVVINAVTTSGTLDTAFVLYPPDGGAAEASTHGSWGGGDQLDYQLLTNGVYTIMIEDHSLVNIGTYNITLMKTPGAVNSPGDLDGGAIASGQTLGGKIAVPSDIDGFQFYGKAGDRVIINAVTASGALDTAIVLYPPDGAAAEASTHGYWGGGDQLDWQVKTNGLYTILIEDHGLSGTGTYYVSLSKIPSTLRPGLYSPCPAVGLTISNSLDLLEWDPVAGATGYDLYFGQNVIAPLARVGVNFPSASFPLPPVSSGNYYVWHVVAHTASGLVDGPYWWFTVGVPSIRLGAAVLLPDRSCKITLQGRLIEPVRIQASTNVADGILDWITLTTLPNLHCSFEYIDTHATNYPVRFYRAVSP